MNGEHDHNNDHDHNHDHDHDHDHGHEEIDAAELADALQLDSRTQIFLELRNQNLELLKVAAQIAGYAREHSPLKPDELRKAMRSIWDVYSEFYEWIDPEESDEEGEGLEDDE